MSSNTHTHVVVRIQDSGYFLAREAIPNILCWPPSLLCAYRELLRSHNVVVVIKVYPTEVIFPKLILGIKPSAKLRSKMYKIELWTSKSLPLTPNIFLLGEEGGFLQC